MTATASWYLPISMTRIELSGIVRLVSAAYFSTALMSSKNTAPEGSRTKPGNLANDGHVGGAYGCLQSPAGLGAPPGFGGTVAPRCITYHSIAHNGCS